MVPTLPPLMTPGVVMTTNPGASSDGKVGIIFKTIPGFQCSEKFNKYTVLKIFYERSVCRNVYAYYLL